MKSGIGPANSFALANRRPAIPDEPIKITPFLGSRNREPLAPASCGMTGGGAMVARSGSTVPEQKKNINRLGFAKSS